ncbi:ISL3 family transposase [Staphylococcus shinii]|uniref:ISL3 family transposase n=3 Tax=Staphylococcus TaxID=1279 RepID=UPI002E19B946|nr:ISL3 family transposase [Staphylococcus shinii]
MEDPNVIFDNKLEEIEYKGERFKCYYAKVTYIPDYCESCGVCNTNYSIVKNGFKSSRITIPKVSEMNAFLILKKQRFYCKHCCSYFTAQTNIVDVDRHISNNTRLTILDKATTIRSQKSIAKSCGVSNSTVSRVINHAAQDIKHLPFSTLPKHILMDEFKSVKQVDSAMSFIFCDATSHKIIDIVRDRKLYSLKNYFSRFPLEERNKVLTVTIDMYEPYMSLIKEVFPNAQIIIDRFHIVQALNRALNMSRVKLMNTFRRSNRPLYNKYKRYWKLLLTPFEDLNAFSYRKLKLFKSWQTPKGVVEYLLSFDTNFQHSYEVVNELRYSLKHNNSKDFITTLNEVELNEVCFKLKIVLKTLKKYQLYIDNTLKYPNITNGPIEGINNKIKLIKRISFGYRNYDNLRNRILLTSRLYASPIKKEIKQPKVA